jgi:hypothetical protein
MPKYALLPAFLLGAFSGAIAVDLLGAEDAPVMSVAATESARIFEMRTYTVAEGQLPALNRRFREHTVRLFSQHGMESIGYWTPVDSALSQTTLVYIIAHPSREAAEQNWAAFRADSTWQRIRAATEARGLRVFNVASMFVVPTDYSAVQ